MSYNEIIKIYLLFKLRITQKYNFKMKFDVNLKNKFFFQPFASQVILVDLLKQIILCILTQLKYQMMSNRVNESELYRNQLMCFFNKLSWGLTNKSFLTSWRNPGMESEFKEFYYKIFAVAKMSLYLTLYANITIRSRIQFVMFEPVT